MNKTPHDLHDDDIDPRIARKRRQAAKRRKRLTIAGIAAAAIALTVVMVAVGVVLSRPGGRGASSVASGILGVSPESEGKTWNHVELRDYLRSKGLPISQWGELNGSGRLVVRVVRFDYTKNEASDITGTYVLERLSYWSSAMQNEWLQ